jgi:SPP1 family phage portal protein
MKKRTIYTLPKDTEVSGDLLAHIIESNKPVLSIFSKLESYVDDEPKMDRTPPNDLLTINNFAQYITSINGGYLLGAPVDYRATGEQKLDPILDVYRQQNIYDLDSDIENDCAMFGQAFETVYVDEDSQVLSAKLSVYNTVVIYDDTFKHEKLMAIYYAPITDAQGRAKTAQYDVTLWDATHITQYKLVGKILTEIEQSEHYFGEVPVIHYLNNKRMKGDYETVISLIDAYNILQSDRVIDREKLVDAILAFYGAKLTEDDRQAIKENRVIGLPEGAKAEYLIKSINESDTDVLRETIAADIHKFSMTPDLTDETFGNAPSGVSILYKLLAFEQNIKKKERQFETALKNRFRLYVTMLSRQSKFSEQLSVADIDVVFSRALPKNDFETSQMINNLDGSVSQETLVGQLSFVNDASDEVKKAAAEKQERMQEANFATSTFPNVDGGNDE